jgi:hypothetical protein
VDGKKRDPTPGGLMKIGPSEARMEELQDDCGGPCRLSVKGSQESGTNKIVLNSRVFLETLWN